MKKSDFIRRVAEEHNVSVHSAKVWVNAIFKTLVHCTIDEPEVNISGFGKFVQVAHKPKKCALPGKERMVPAKKHLKFYPSVYIKAAMEDGISSEQFEKNMEIYRALDRGEVVPGYAKSKHRHTIVAIDEPIEIEEDDQEE